MVIITNIITTIHLTGMGIKNIKLNYNPNKALIRNIQNAGLYFFGSVLQGILALIAQPIYSLHLTASEFGIIGYFGSIQSIFSPIFILGMSSVYLMRYFKQGDDENKKLLFNITFFVCCFNTVTIFVGYLCIYLYFKNMHVIIPLNPFGWFILVVLLFENIKSAVLINFRIRKKAFSFFTFSAVNSIFNFGLGILFVAYWEWGAIGRMLAPLISSILLLPSCIYILRKYTTINFNISLFLNALKIALPIVFASYAFVPIANIDVILLERINNLAELGLYSIGMTIAGYIQLVFVALSLAFEPDIFQSVAEKNKKGLNRTGAIIFIPYLLAVLIFLMLSGNIISILTAGRYTAATRYTNIVLISVFLMGIFSFFTKILIALEKTKLHLIVNSIGGVSAFIIMYLMVSNFAYLGAAYGRILISVVMILLSSMFALYQLKKQGITV